METKKGYPIHGVNTTGGLCECGCGQLAPIAPITRRGTGVIKGQPTRFVRGHTAGTHGHKRGGRQTREYTSFVQAKSRCTNPKDSAYDDYGGRGIKFLFTSFEQFYAEIGPKPKDYILDRTNNSGNYEPGNVRWVTAKVSANNRRRRKLRFIGPALKDGHFISQVKRRKLQERH